MQRVWNKCRYLATVLQQEQQVQPRGTAHIGRIHPFEAQRREHDFGELHQTECGNNIQRDMVRKNES